MPTHTQLAKRLKGHENKVMSVDVAPTGNRLVSCAYDGTFKLWEKSEEYAFLPPFLSLPTAPHTFNFHLQSVLLLMSPFPNIVLR